MSDYGVNLTQEPSQNSWDPRSGWTVKKAWRGTPLAIAAQMLILQRLRIPFDHEVSQTGGKERIEARLGAQDTQPETQPLSDEWVLEGNDIEKDIWVHPRVKALFEATLDGSGFPTDTTLAIRQDIDAVLAGQMALADVPWWSGASSDTKKLMRALLRGETSYLDSQYVLKRVQIVASNYRNKPDYSRVNKVITGDLLKQLNPLPSYIKFTLPNGYWMERTPTIELEPPDKYKVSREWWNFQEFDDFLYDVATS